MEIEEDGTFDLFKDAAANEAIRIGEQETATASNEPEVSAADYNPDEDRKRDDRRQAEREGAKAAPVEELKGVEAAATTVDDDDDDDMFSIGVKPVKVDDGPPKPAFIPVRSTRAFSSSRG